MVVGLGGEERSEVGGGRSVEAWDVGTALCGAGRVSGVGGVGWGWGGGEDESMFGGQAHSFRVGEAGFGPFSSVVGVHTRRPRESGTG